MYTARTLQRKKPCYGFLTILLINLLSMASIFTYGFQLALLGYPLFILAQLTLTLLTSTFGMLATYANPGVIPSRPFLVIYDQADPLNKIRSFVTTNADWLVPHPRAALTKLKSCFSCQIWRPFRAVHCDACDCCVMELDHHCPWLGTCIGLYNYRHFLLFVNLLFWLILNTIIGGPLNMFL